MLSYGGVTVDLGKHRVIRDGRSVHLSPSEFRLLCTLLERPGHVFSRDTPLNRVSGCHAAFGRAAPMCISGRLRKALNAGGEARTIRTIRSAGYAPDRERN